MTTLYSAFVQALGALVGIASLFGFAVPSQTSILHVPEAHAASSINSESPQQIATDLQQSGLPIARVKVDQTPGATGTVIYIPQVHLTPGSNPMDPQNDQAVATQNQIASIVSGLSQTKGEKLVMMEGDLYGPVAPTSTAIVAQQLRAAQALRNAASSIENVCQSTTCQQSVAGAQTIANQLDREATLAGGAKVAKAQGGSFSLWGAEDPSVQSQAGSIVRNYVYLNDRLNQLTGSDKAASAVAGPLQPTGLTQTPVAGNPLIAAIEAMSQQQQQSSLNQQEISQLSAYGSHIQSAALEGDATNLSTAFAQAQQAQESYSSTLRQAQAGLPTRSDNPYANITNVQTLQSDLAQSENQITNTIVDERNSVASQHFATTLAQTGNTTGVLIYGAGHTAGLIQDLQDQHLNVVVVVPQSLASNQELQAALAS